MWNYRSAGTGVVLGSLLILGIAACGDSTGPGPDEGELEFTYGGDAGSFSARGDVVLTGGVPDFDEWALAAEPDSVGGIVVTAFQPSATAGQGDLFILQIQPADGEGTYEPCGPDEVCRGRLFQGWKTDLSGYAAWFEVVSGSVEIDELSDARIRGSFTLTLREDGGQGPAEIVISDGAFDVPVSDAAGLLFCELPQSAGCGS